MQYNCMFVFKKYDRQNHVWSFMTKYLRFLCKFTSWSGEIPEDKHQILLHLSIFYEYQQFFQHRICFSIQPSDYGDPWHTLARSTSFFLIMLFNNFSMYSCLCVLHGFCKFTSRKLYKKSFLGRSVFRAAKRNFAIRN
jgi:hypothetical protein